MSDSPEVEDGGGDQIPLTQQQEDESIEDSDIVVDEEAKSVPTDTQVPQISSSAASAEIPDETSSPQLECPICLQICVHPVELPCRHIFCFLCIKGVAMQGPHGRCAICRSNIPHNVLTHPRLKDISQLYKHVKSVSGYEWFYEARGGGWWQYDERSMQELEKAFESGQSTCQLLIAGHLYEMDFPQMIQYRLNNRNLFRRIKRDVSSAEKRGIAGIRLSQGRGGNNGNNADSSTSTTDNNRRGRGGRTNAGQSQTSTQSTSPSQRSGNQQGQNDASQPPSRASTGSGHVIVLSESESDNDEEEEIQDEEADSDDPEYLEDEEEMELGEEEELGESVDEDPSSAEEDLRDGARAPTRRSDRSNSSTNQTPPPNGVVTNGSSSSRNHNSSPNSNPNGRASRGARSDRSSAGSRSNQGINNSSSGGGIVTGGGVVGRPNQGSSSGGGSSSASSPSPQFLIDGGIRTISAGSSIRLISPGPTDMPPTLSHVNVGFNNNGGSSSRTSSSSSIMTTSSITTTTGITCLLIGPGVRITVDQENSNGDEIL